MMRLTVEIISFSEVCFSGVSIENGAIEGGIDTDSHFSCFRIEKKRLFEFRASKLFRFQKCVFRGFRLRMGL